MSQLARPVCCVRCLAEGPEQGLYPRDAGLDGLPLGLQLGLQLPDLSLHLAELALHEPLCLRVLGPRLFLAQLQPSAQAVCLTPAGPEVPLGRLAVLQLPLDGLQLSLELGLASCFLGRGLEGAPGAQKVPRQEQVGLRELGPKPRGSWLC